MKKILKWIKVSFLESILFAYYWLFLVFFRKKNLSWKNLEKDTTPLLLIHGYLNNPYVWLFHGKKFRKNFSHIYTFDLRNSFHPINELSLKLKKQLHLIQKETNKKNITLIGHSLGGLVASYYALNIDEDHDVKDVITIGSPLNGSVIAKLGFGKSARQMEFHSRFVEKLKKKILKNKRINFYHIATKSDQLVKPYDSALLGDDKEKQFVVDGIGHNGLLYSKKINKKITKWLI